MVYNYPEETKKQMKFIFKKIKFKIKQPALM